MPRWLGRPHETLLVTKSQTQTNSPSAEPMAAFNIRGMERVTQHLKRFAAEPEFKREKPAWKGGKKLLSRRMHMSEWVHRDYIKSRICFTDTLTVSWRTDQKPPCWRWRTLPWVTVSAFTFMNVIFITETLHCGSHNMVRDFHKSTVYFFKKALWHLLT